MAGYATKSLLYHKLRLAISILGIAIAISLIIVINGFAEGFYKQASNFYRNTPSQIIVAQNDQGLIGGSSLLPSNQKKEIDESAEVSRVSEVMFTPVIYENVPTVFVGFEDKKLGGPWQIKEGRNIQKDNEIVLDAAFSQENDIEINDKIKILGQKLKVVGLSGGTSSFIQAINFMTLNKMRQLTNSANLTSYFLVKSSNTSASMDSIKDNITKGNVYTNARIGQEEELDVKNVMSSPINIISLIAFFIGLLVVALTSYVSTLSRINEFGILKAIGGNSAKLFSIVIKQSFINTLLGLIVGIGVSFLLANSIASIYPKFLIFITTLSLIKTSVIALVLAVLASVVPIRKVAAVDPVLVFK